MLQGYWPKWTPSVLLAFLAPVVAAPAAAHPQAPPEREPRLRPVAVSPAEIGSRDAGGQLVIRAQRLREALTIDGNLDESIYARFRPAGGFVQAEPHYNEPATEQTELWVFFDDRAVYIGLRCFDSRPDLWTNLDQRRDAPGFGGAESVSVALDTFNDKRNGYTFGINPDGGLSDSAITDERDSNRDWNTIWDTRTGRFDGGWTAELAIPFKSLRYTPGEQTWGINVRRTVRWKNEISFLNSVPPTGQLPPQFGLFRFSSAATLAGLAAPPESRLFEVKPYGISSLKTDLGADAPFSNQGSAAAGLDAKIGVTRGLVADFTYNTDFAQVEEDEQQVNLTRFSLFFPEKREFFLEGQGIFAFGGFTQRRGGAPGEVPLPFFSRRIGIDDDGNPVPILGGGRLTGRAGNYSMGVVNIQTKQDDMSREPSTNFSVVRLRRDVLTRSNVGLIFVNRSAYGTRLSASQVYGADGVFSFFDNINLNAYIARTATPGLRGDDFSHRVQLEYNADRYGAELEDMRIGRNFNPEVGYVRRTDVHRNAAQFRFSPRPRSNPVVRRFNLTAGVDRFIRLSDGDIDTRTISGSLGIEFESSDDLTVEFSDYVEDLPESFDLFDIVAIPVGRYHFRTLSTAYRLGNQHYLSGEVKYNYGGFYGGSKHSIDVTRGRVEPVPSLFVEPGLSINWVDIPQGRFTAKVLNSRIVYTLSPRAYASALVQYNSSDNLIGLNARFRWEYRPGSDLFVVYSDGRSTLNHGFPTLQNRALTVKLTRFFRL